MHTLPPISMSNARAVTRASAPPRRLQEDERVAKKLYVALVLHDIISEVPMAAVEAKYGMHRNMIAKLQVRGAGGAGRWGGRGAHAGGRVGT